MSVTSSLGTDSTAPTINPKRWTFLFLALTSILVLFIGLWLIRLLLPIHTQTVQGEVSDLRYSPDGKLIAMIVRRDVFDAPVVLYDARTLRAIRTIPGRFDQVVLTGNDQRLITISSVLRPVKAPDYLFTSRSGHVEHVRLANPYRWIMQQWDIATGKLIWTDDLPHSWLIEGYSKDRRLIALSGGGLFGHSVWNSETGRCILDTHRACSAVFGAISPNGNFLACGTIDGEPGKMGLWYLRNGSRITALDGKTSDIQAVAFSSDSRLLATASKTRITVWDTSTWQAVHAWSVSYPGFVNIVRFTPGGRELVENGELNGLAPTDGPEVFTTDFWDVSSGRRIHRALHEYLSGLSPDGKLAVTQHAPVTTGDRFSLNLWNACSGKHLASYLAPDNFSGMSSWSFSPDSRVFVTSESVNIPMPPTMLTDRWQREQSQVRAISAPAN